jgi:hypothetical protein
MTIKETIQKNKETLVSQFGKDFFQDVSSLGLMAFSILVVLAIVLLLVFTVKPTTNLIPLVYNSTFGVTDLGTWYKIYFYPIAYFGFALLNFGIAWAFFDKKRLITYLVLFVHDLIGIILFIEVYYLTILIRG